MTPSRLFLIGIILVLLGTAILAFGSLGSGSTSVGGVVFIGPLPLVFGSGPNSGLLALTAVVIGAVMVIVLYLNVLLRRRSRGSA